MLADFINPAGSLAFILCAVLALSFALQTNFSVLGHLLLDRANETRNRFHSPLVVTSALLITVSLIHTTPFGANYLGSIIPGPESAKLPHLLTLATGSLILAQFSVSGAEIRKASQVWMIFFTSLSLAFGVFAPLFFFNDGVGDLTTLQIAIAFVLLWALVAMTVIFLFCSKVLIDLLQHKNRKAENVPDLVAADRNPKRARGHQNQQSDFSITGILKSCAWALWGVFFVSFVTNLLMLTGPLFMLQIYDRVLASRSIPTLTALLALVAGLFVILGILELLRSRILVRVGQRIDRRINKVVFKRVVSVPDSDEKSETRNLMQDLDSVRQFFSSSAPAAMLDLPWTPLYFAIIFLFHPTLGLLAISGAFILFLISICNEFASKKAVARASQTAMHSASLVEAGRRNAETLHAMGMFQAFQQRWLGIHRSGISHHLVAADVSGTMSGISKVTRLFLQSLMLAGGAYYAVAGEISAGVIVAASIILSRALAPIEQIVGQWRNILIVRNATGRLSKVLTEHNRDDAKMTLPEPKGVISAERLYAGPPGTHEPILKGLNFTAGPGDAVAVVGSNASGKSTLARVLVGVWPAMRGHVRLDGASLSQWPPQQLGNSIGYLPQDVELFEGTVADNISRFDPDASPDLILEAAYKAHVHDLVTRLPDGYATRLGEGGASISGGQRQRIALARALYGNPALIVLDEPNANLDNEGELALTAAIKSLRESGSTIIVMAHRPNVLSAVNLVMVLRNGRQVSFGEKSQALKDNVTQVNPNHGKNSYAKSTAPAVSAV